MSASLVGSEMCIRDRSCAAGAFPRPGSRSSWHLWNTGWRPTIGPTVLPVSYTHLTLPTICSV
eukprot:390703-Alexandrium_andersonii.AAC.1